MATLQPPPGQGREPLRVGYDLVVGADGAWSKVLWCCFFFVVVFLGTPSHGDRWRCEWVEEAAGRSWLELPLFARRLLVVRVGPAVPAG